MLCACSSGQKWHYRMTVTVETPEGLKSGSAVREVGYATGWGPFPEQGPHITYRGEAVVVDLGKYGVLFALNWGGVNSREYGSDVLLVTLPPLDKQGRHELSPRRVPPKGKRVVLTSDKYPIFVRFRDLRDPTTIENVTDRSSRKDWRLDGEKFGEGVKLKQITIEVTDDPLTHGVVNKWLPWLYDRSKTPAQNRQAAGDIRVEKSLKGTGFAPTDFVDFSW